MIEKIRKYKVFFKTSAIYLGSSLLVSLIGIAINPLLAMNLSPMDYAIVGYYASFNLLLVPLVHFNTMTYYLRNYYRIPEDQRERVGDTILIGLIFVGMAVFILFTAGFYIYSRCANIEFPFFPYAILTFAQVYVSVFTTFYLTKLRINRQANRFGTVSIINALVVTVLTLLLVVYYKYGADGKLYAAFIGALIMGVYSFVKALDKWQFDFVVYKKALKFGLPLTISALFWYVLSGIDRAMLVDLDDSFTYGIYCVAIQMANYLTIFYTAMNNTVEPDIYKAIAEHKTQRLIKLMLGVVVIISLANLAFIAFAPFIVGILTANRYIASTEFAQILAVHNITMACYYMVVKLLIGYGYVKTELVVRITGSLFVILMFKLLIDNYGFYGAAWGQVFSFLILSIIGLIAFFIMRRRNKYIQV